MANRFDQAYTGKTEELGPPNPLDAPSVSTSVAANPLDVSYEAKSQPAVSNPIPSSPENPLDVDSAEQVKSIIGAMPQFREGFLGVEQVREPKAQTFKQGEYTLQNALTPKFVRDTIARADAEYEQSDKSAFANLKRDFATGQALRDYHEYINPINVVARNTVGAALKTAQENVGRPLASMAIKGAMSLDNSPAGKEFQERHKGSTSAELRPPSKYVTPGAHELLLRRFFSSLGSDKVKMSRAKEAEAMPSITGLEIGGVEIAPLVASAVELGGELPFYALLRTGAGVRAEAGAMKRIEQAREGGALLTPKEVLKHTKAAQRHGAATEFAAQNAVVAAKNSEDLGGAAIEGYVAGQVLEAFGQFVSRGKGAKKAILSPVNKEREGLLLPPITWQEYVKSAAESAKPKTLAQIKEKGKNLMGKQLADSLHAFESVNVGKKSNASVDVKGAGSSGYGTGSEPYTFKTVEFDKSGGLVETRYSSNAKTGKTKAVYSRPLNSKHIAEYEKSGMPEKTDLAAYAEMMYQMYPNKVYDPRALRGTVGVSMSPEQVEKWVAESGLTLDEFYKMADIAEANAAAKASGSGAKTTPGKVATPVVEQELTRPISQTVEIAGHNIPYDDGVPDFESNRVDNPQLFNGVLGQRRENMPGIRRIHNGMGTDKIQDIQLQAPRGGTQTNKLLGQEVALRREALAAEDAAIENNNASMYGRAEELQNRALNVENEVDRRLVSRETIEVARAAEHEAEYLENHRYGGLDREQYEAMAGQLGHMVPGGVTRPIGDIGTRPLLPPPPRLLTVEPSGTVRATPIIDRTVSTTALSPRHVKEGDVVHVGDDIAIVDNVRDGEVTLNIKGQKHVASQAEVALADENILDLNYFLPEYSASPKKGTPLLKFKELDIKRVMNAAKIGSPVEAKKFLDDMVKAGQLTPESGGVWRVNKSYKPEAPDEPLNGGNYRVYFDVTADGQGKSGILRGRDPKKLGNVLIEIGQQDIGPRTAQMAGRAQQLGVQPEDLFLTSKLISVPKSQVRSYLPVLPNGNLSTLPQQYGISVPMPQDVMITNAAAAKAMSDYTRMNGQLNKLLDNRSVVERGLQKLFQHDAWLVPIDLRQHATTLAAQPALVKAQTEVIQTALAKRLGGELSVDDIWLSHIAKRRATRQGRAKLSEQEQGLLRFFAANPQLAGEAEQTVRTALDRLKFQQNELARMGVTNIADLEASRALGLEDEYAMNVYMKYLTSRKDFAKFVQKQMPDEWRRAVEHVAKRHPNEAVWQTEARMLDILGMDIDSLAKQAAKNPSGEVAKKLKERVKMAEEIATIIGKLDSASVQVAHSLAASESILRRVSLWNDLAATDYWAPGPRPDLGPHGGVPVPNSPIFGNARGGRMHESFRFLLEAKPAHVEARSVLRTMASMWKFNQVVGGGMGPWVNQVMRNWKGLIASGGVQDASDFATFFDAAAQMQKYSANPILAKGTFYDALMQNGGIGTGFAGSEINKHKAANRILDAIRKQKGNSQDVWDLLSNVSSHIRGTAEEVGAAYDAIDRLFKLTAGMNNYRRFLSKGMSADDAMALTVMRNNQSFVNFEMVSPVVEKLRNSPISGVAPFISSKMEDMRINGTILMRMANEPDLVARMAAATGVIGATLALMREQRRANGISDERVKQDLDKQKLSTQAYKPLAMIWPELDSEGRTQVVDVTMWEDLFMMMQMHERDFAPAAILRNNVTGVFGEETLLGRATDQMFNVAGGTVPLSALPQIVERPGEQGWVKALSMIAENGGLPNAPFKGYRTYMKGQPPTTLAEELFREQWTPEQVKWKNMGLPFAGPIGQKTELGRIKEFGATEREFSNQIRGVIMNTPEGERQPKIDAKLKAMDEVKDEFQENR